MSLGRVQSEVGATQQRVDVASFVRIQNHTGRDAKLDLVSVD